LFEDIKVKLSLY